MPSSRVSKRGCVCRSIVARYRSTSEVWLSLYNAFRLGRRGRGGRRGRACLHPNSDAFRGGIRLSHPSSGGPPHTCMLLRRNSPACHPSGRTVLTAGTYGRSAARGSDATGASFKSIRTYTSSKGCAVSDAPHTIKFTHRRHPCPRFRSSRDVARLAATVKRTPGIVHGK